MNFDINNPNEFVLRQPEADTLPKGTIGKGGLSAMADAAHGSPTQPKLMGGLQGEKGQDDLEGMLFPRIRNMDQINEARGARRSKLAELQEALQSPDNDFTGIDYIARGMMQNDDPSNVGKGFRKGVAAAMDARLARGASKKKGAIDAADVGLKFEKEEGTNDEQLENTAISNLRALAKPLLSRGAGSGAGGGRGNPFRWVPGTGLVNLSDIDESTGKPRLVFGDSKTGQGIRSTAIRMAMQEVESNLHKMTFLSSEEKAEYVEARANEIAADIVGGGAPQAGGNGGRGGPAGGLAAPVAPPAAPGKKGMATPASAAAAAQTPDWKHPDSGGRFDTLKFELDEAVKAGRTQDVQMLRNEIKNLPANERPANYMLETPEVRAGKSKFNEKMAETSVGYYDKLRGDSEVALKVKSTVNELKQLKVDTGAFTKWKQKGGNILEALGSDGPLARSAARSGNAEALLQGLSNARITLEKGVQTKDDELRFKREIAQITDPKEGYKYMLKYMDEMANKSVEQFNTVENYRKNNGSLDGAEQAWQKRNQEFGGVVKRYQGAFVGRSEFIAAMMKANAAAYKGKEDKLRADVEKAWNALGSGK